MKATKLIGPLLLILIWSFIDQNGATTTKRPIRQAALRGRERSQSVPSTNSEGHHSGSRTRSRSHSPQSKPHITEKTVKSHIGHGGTYKKLEPHAKAGLVNRDHIPPKRLYKFSPNEKIRGIKSNKMAAITIPENKHQKLLTSNNPNHKFMKKLEKKFTKGNYKGALNNLIQMYKTNLSRSGQSQGAIHSKTKSGARSGSPTPGDMSQGLKNMLAVNVKNGLINNDQKNRLISRHKL